MLKWLMIDTSTIINQKLVLEALIGLEVWSYME